MNGRFMALLIARLVAMISEGNMFRYEGYQVLGNMSKTLQR